MGHWKWGDGVSVDIVVGVVKGIENTMTDDITDWDGTRQESSSPDVLNEVGIVRTDSLNKNLFKYVVVLGRKWVPRYLPCCMRRRDVLG